MIGSGARQNSSVARCDPEATEANSSAAAIPAPNPTRKICIIASCPASSAVRDGSRSAPTFIERRVTDRTSLPVSPDHIGQEPQETRALDRLRELALLLGRHRGDAAWHDLAALGHVALQQAGVLVIDLRRIGTGEWAGLAAAEERPAGLRWCEAHSGHSSVSAGASSRGGRLSRR